MAVSVCERAWATFNIDEIDSYLARDYLKPREPASRAKKQHDVTLFGVTAMRQPMQKIGRLRKGSFISPAGTVVPFKVKLEI